MTSGLTSSRAEPNWARAGFKMPSGQATGLQQGRRAKLTRYLSAPFSNPIFSPIGDLYFFSTHATATTMLHCCALLCLPPFNLRPFGFHVPHIDYFSCVAPPTVGMPMCFPPPTCCPPPASLPEHCPPPACSLLPPILCVSTHRPTCVLPSAHWLLACCPLPTANPPAPYDLLPSACHRTTCAL